MSFVLWKRVICIKITNMEENGPLIDLRLVKKVNVKINEKQKKSKFNIINGNLNLLGWVFLKSGIVFIDKYDPALAKLNILDPKKYWQKLVNTDNKRSIIFSGNDHAKRFRNEDIPFHIVKSKYLNDYDVAFKHLNEEYDLRKIDYKLCHPIFFVMMNTAKIIKKIIGILISKNLKWC